VFGCSVSLDEESESEGGEILYGSASLSTSANNKVELSTSEYDGGEESKTFLCRFNVMLKTDKNKQLITQEVKVVKEIEKKKDKGNNSTGVVIGVLVALIIIGVIAAFFIYRSRRNNMKRGQGTGAVHMNKLNTDGSANA